VQNVKLPQYRHCELTQLSATAVKISKILFYDF
jgi:hypothetical protein